MTNRTAWLCDFDGTISPSDIGASLVRRFAPEGGERRRDLFEKWKREEIGSRELTCAESADVRVTAEAAIEFTRGFEIDPGFAGFVREARERGEEIAVLSDGYEFYIHDHLSRAGLADVPCFANVARFEGDRLTPEFPWPGGCGRCGNCKGAHARGWRERGFEVCVVGDGYSDRCAAREADRVFARGSLLEWCRNEDREATPFEGFAALAVLAAESAAARSGRGAA
jgi:2-hydroxy-3-keto-5-methylthiopentenyl-1-phosphate phosphatase